LVGTEIKDGERFYSALEALLPRIAGDQKPGSKPDLDNKGKSEFTSRKPTDNLHPALEAMLRKIIG